MGIKINNIRSGSDLAPGIEVDIRDLEKINRDGSLEIILYFEEDLARNSTYAQDLITYQRYPEHERPFISLEGFLGFQREMNPMFDDALRSIPIHVSIINITEREKGLQIIGLLPFVDEMNLG